VTLAVKGPDLHHLPGHYLALVSSVFGRAYGRRITVEERLLARDLPDYPAYQRRTKRLLPFVW